MTLIVKFKPTGQVGSIPDNEFDPNIYEVVSRGDGQEQSVTQHSQEPQSFLGKIGRGALDIGKSIVDPFVETGKNIGTAAVTIPQAALATALSGVNPELGAKYASKVSEMDILGTQSRAQDIADNPKDAIGNQIADSLEIASYAVPFGKAREGANIAERALTKAILPGAATGALISPETTNLILGDEVNADELAGSMVLGAAIPTVIQGLAKGARGIRKVGNLMKGQAPRAAEKSFKPTKTQINAFKKKFGIDLGEYSVDRGLQGLSADTIYDDVIGPVQNQYDDIARKSGIEVTKDQLDKKFMEYLEPLIDSPSTEDAKLAEKLIEEYDQILRSTGLGNNGVTDISNITNAKTTFGNKVKGWMGNPIEGGKNRVMSTVLNDTAQVAANQAEQGLGTKMADIGKELQKLYSYADVVNIQSGKGRGTLPIGLMKILGIGGGASLAGAPGALATTAAVETINRPETMSLVSKALDKAGGSLSKFPNYTPSSAVLKGATQSGVRISDRQPQQDAVDLATLGSGVQLQGQPQAQNQSLTGYEPRQLYEGYTQALAAGDTKAAAQLRKMYEDETDFRSSGNQKPPTVAQMTRNEMTNTINRISQQFEQSKDKLGIFPGYTQSALSIINAGDQDVLDFYNTASQLKASIAKARAGTSFTPNEEALLNQYTPKKGDSIQSLQTKINGLLFLANSSLSQPISDSQITQ